jgi:hypothetical protein
MEITFVLWDEDTDGVAVKHDGVTVWQERSFDSLAQYLRTIAPLGLPVTIEIEEPGCDERGVHEANAGDLAPEREREG